MPGVRCVSVLTVPMGLPGDSGRRARPRRAQVRVGRPRRPVAALAGGGGRALGPGSLPLPSPPPRPPQALVCLRAGSGALRQQKRLPSARCHLLGFHTSGGVGGGSRCPFPSVCGRPPPPARGLGVSASQRGGAQGLGGERAAAAGRGPSGQGPGRQPRGSLTDYSAAERSLPNPPLCPGSQPRARSDKLLSRRLPVRAKKRRRSRADAKSPALGPGEAGAGLQEVGEGLLSAAAAALGLPLCGCIPSGAPARPGEPRGSWALASYADSCCRWSGRGWGADPCFFGSTLEPGECRLTWAGRRGSCMEAPPASPSPSLPRQEEFPQPSGPGREVCHGGKLATSQACSSPISCLASTGFLGCPKAPVKSSFWGCRGLGVTR